MRFNIAPKQERVFHRIVRRQQREDGLKADRPSISSKGTSHAIERRSFFVALRLRPRRVPRLVLLRRFARRAQTVYYWNVGSGAWDTTSSNWTTSVGSSSTTWTGGSPVDFYSNQPGGATVAVSGDQTVGNITFDGSGYTVTGDQLNLATAGTTTVTTNANAEIDSNIRRDSDALTKSGSGTLTLGGVNAYSGATVVNGGTLKLAAPSTGLGYFPITGDGDSGISTNKIYTHAINPSGGGFSINGVPFTGAASGTLAANSLTPQSYAQGGNTVVIGNSIGVSDFGDSSVANNLNGWSGVSGNLLNLYGNFNWNTPNPRTVVLTGLQPNTLYDLVLYEKQWTNDAGRLFSIGYDVGDTGTPQFTSPTIDQNEPAKPAACGVEHRPVQRVGHVLRLPDRVRPNFHRLGREQPQHRLRFNVSFLRAHQSTRSGAACHAVDGCGGLDAGSQWRQPAGCLAFGLCGRQRRERDQQQRGPAACTLTLNPKGSTTFRARSRAAAAWAEIDLAIVGSGTQVLRRQQHLYGRNDDQQRHSESCHPLAVQNSTVTVGSSGSLTFAAGIANPILGGLAGPGGVALATAAAEPVRLSVGQNGQNTTYSGNLSGGGAFQDERRR